MSDQTQVEETVVDEPATVAATAPVENPNEVTFWFREPSAEAKKKNPGITKRSEVKLLLPFVDAETLQTSMSDEKISSWIVDIINNAITDEARTQVNDPKTPVNTQEALDITKLSLEYLADKPSERKARGIPKEDWELFEADFNEVMPTMLTLDSEKVKKAAKLLVSQMRPVKNSKPVLNVLQQYLTSWFGAKPEEEQEVWAKLYGHLMEKFTEYLAITDDDMLKDLV